MYGDLTDAVLKAVAKDKSIGGATNQSSTSVVSPSQQHDSEVIARARAKEKELLDMYEKTKIRADFTVAVPTNDIDVRKALRGINEPISLFGEDSFERRQRLKLLLQSSKPIKVEEYTEVAKKTEKTFYTYGTANLLEARKAIFQSSWAAAAMRRQKIRDEGELSRYWSEQIEAHSQVAGGRPLSAVAFDPTGRIALGSWSGETRVFNPAGTLTHTLVGHTDRCASVAWHPTESACIATGGSDMKIKLWDLNSSDSPVGSFEGHELRINRIAFHPHNTNILFSSSDDETWRMWDIERREELLLQEGHVSAVFALACHPDGSLLASSDTSGVVRVWDLRTGRAVMGFEGHMEQVVGLDFSPNGVTLASGSGDNSVRIWDLRKKKCLAILAGHEKLVSCVKFDRLNGEILLTSSYDCVAKIWDARNGFKIVKNLPIHESRIMAADISHDGKAVVTACYDRTFKVWSAERVKEDGLKMEH